MTTETDDRADHRNLIRNTFHNLYHQPCTVRYDDDAETIHVTLSDDTMTFTMFISSDDDDFLFVSDADPDVIVRFPIPE